MHRLTGFYQTGWGCVDPTGLFDMQNHSWATSLLAQVGIRLDQLLEIYPPRTILGTVTPIAAEACGLPVGLPVVAGIGDGQACDLEVNITSPGDAYLLLDTSVISGITGNGPTRRRLHSRLVFGKNCRPAGSGDYPTSGFL